MGSKPKIILVTGFLGSGKTTLINRLIEYYRDKKIGLIINDFGQISVDGMLVENIIHNAGKEESTNIFEITNGSIFCSCLSAELVTALKEFVNINPEVLIIETSGLSDPSTFNKILEENKLNEYYEVISSICIVDPTKTPKLATKILAIERQIKSCNIIIVNKIDICEEHEYRSSYQLIEAINTKVKIIDTKYAEFDISKIEEKFEYEINPVTETCNTVSSRPGSIVLNPQNATKEFLFNLYNEINSEIFRIKGFLKIDGQNYYIYDNNDTLHIVIFEKEIEQYGLSVLLPVNKINTAKEIYVNFKNNN
ncbi:MAG: GTP-binding protein [Bacteroidota bacterium]